jgi:metal-responsive CopG/Arc/MetJ family transcriptional regulator
MYYITLCKHIFPSKEVKMAVLTVNDNLLREIDDSAQLEKVSREEFIQNAISVYQRQKAWERLQVFGAKMIERGITDEDVDEAIREVRAEMRHEKR